PPDGVRGHRTGAWAPGSEPRRLGAGVSLLVKLLAADTTGRRGLRLQALRGDLPAAHLAQAICSLGNAAQRAVDASQLVGVALHLRIGYVDHQIRERVVFAITSLLGDAHVRFVRRPLQRLA